MLKITLHSKLPLQIKIFYLIDPDGVLKDKPIEEIFDAFEFQRNTDADENWERNRIKELNELHTAGLSTPDYFTQDLRKTSK